MQRSAIVMLRCLSSEKRVYCNKTAAVIITLLSLKSSLMVCNFRLEVLRRNSKGSQAGGSTYGDVEEARFFQKQGAMTRKWSQYITDSDLIKSWVPVLSHYLSSVFK